VYWNLHKKCWSVRENGVVQYHTPSLEITSAQFRVWKGGQERVRKTQRKNVHAFVVGTVAKPGDLSGGIPVTYNPYKYDTFVRLDTGEPIYEAARVVMFGAARVLAFLSSRSGSDAEPPTE
jgi:hypothetical protein